MTLYSQRDSRWKDEILGTKGTIGMYGCTITCVGYLADLNPHEVNERLKSVGGYANGNLILWQKINEAIPWLKWEWRGYIYDNDKVAANLPCLVKVDASRIGGTKHWVVYIGNQQLFDPWDGDIKSTSYYPPTGYSIIKIIGTKPGVSMDMYKGLDLDNKDSMKVAVDVWDRLQKGELVEKSAVAPDTGWEMNGKSVTTVNGNVTTTINYKKI